MRLRARVRFGAVPVEQVRSSAERCADRLECLLGVYMLGRVEAQNDACCIVLHAESGKLHQVRRRTARVSRLRRNRAAKRKLAVLRNSGAGCPASIGTIPLNDINPNKIVHPSIFYPPWFAILKGNSRATRCCADGAPIATKPPTISRRMTAGGHRPLQPGRYDPLPRYARPIRCVDCFTRPIRQNFPDPSSHTAYRTGNTPFQPFAICVKKGTVPHRNPCRFSIEHESFHFRQCRCGGSRFSCNPGNQSPGQTPHRKTEVERTMVTTYCVTCHNARLKTGGLALDGLDLAKAPRGRADLGKGAAQAARTPDAAAGQSATEPGRTWIRSSPGWRTRSTTASRARRPRWSKSRLRADPAPEPHRIRRDGESLGGRGRERQGSSAAGHPGGRLRQYRGRLERVSRVPRSVRGRGAARRTAGGGRSATRAFRV